MSKTVAATIDNDGLGQVMVRSLLIPLNGIWIVLPNTAVAEVTSFKSQEPVADAPDWVLGRMTWRGRAIPSLAFEPLLGMEAGIGGAHARAIVCNTLNANPDLPFLAIVAQGIPHLQDLRAEMIETVSSDAEEISSIAGRLRLGEREVVIPNLDDLERQLLQSGIKVI
ncbi:MAG: chemotaxis protein CheW [Thiohalomonadaceae bacterium]